MMKCPHYDSPSMQRSCACSYFPADAGGSYGGNEVAKPLETKNQYTGAPPATTGGVQTEEDRAEYFRRLGMAQGPTLFA